MEIIAGIARLSTHFGSVAVQKYDLYPKSGMLDAFTNYASVSMEQGAGQQTRISRLLLHPTLMLL
eukprot:3403345-Amphidinium_carterae.2